MSMHSSKRTMHGGLHRDGYSSVTMMLEKPEAYFVAQGNLRVPGPLLYRLRPETKLAIMP